METVTVTAEDAYGNTDPSYAGSVAITSSDGQAVLPAAATLTDGMGTFNVTLKTAGTESVTATDTLNTGITGTESGITVTPGSATQLVVTGASGETAGGVETVTVTAEDAYGNTDTSYAGSVEITSSDGQAVLPATATLTNGVGTFNVTLKTPAPSRSRRPTGNTGHHRHGVGHHRHPGAATQLVVTGASAETAGGVRDGHGHRRGPLRQHRSQLRRHACTSPAATARPSCPRPPP